MCVKAWSEAPKTFDIGLDMGQKDIIIIYQAHSVT